MVLDCYKFSFFCNKSVQKKPQRRRNLRYLVQAFSFVQKQKTHSARSPLDVSVWAFVCSSSLALGRSAVWSRACGGIFRLNNMRKFQWGLCDLLGSFTSERNVIELWRYLLSLVIISQHNIWVHPDVLCSCSHLHLLKTTSSTWMFANLLQDREWWANN